MMRALWTGASGMIAQQTNVDTISNNLANVNTVGYKKETVEFKSLLYQKLQTKTTDNNGDPKPVIGQVGSGTRTGAITSRFTQGPLQSTENPFDLAIDGEGFFTIQMPDGSTAYTRNGSFKVSLMSDNTLALCTSEGYPVLDATGTPVTFASSYDVADISIDSDGKVIYEKIEEVTDILENGEAGETHTRVTYETLAEIGLTQFNNPSGLEKISGSLYKETAASGAPRAESTDTNLKKSTVLASYLEGSNVQTVDEIVNLIVAQRAYEMNSKTITAADEMLQQANNLRG